MIEVVLVRVDVPLSPGLNSIGNFAGGMWRLQKICFHTGSANKRHSLRSYGDIQAANSTLCGIDLDGSGLEARVGLGGPRQCLRVDILPDVRQFAISNSNGEDPIVLERPIRGYDSPPSEADDENSVSLRYEFARLHK